MLSHVSMNEKLTWQSTMIEEKKTNLSFSLLIISSNGANSRETTLF